MGHDDYESDRAPPLATTLPEDVRAKLTAESAPPADLLEELVAAQIPEEEAAPTLKPCPACPHCIVCRDERHVLPSVRAEWFRVYGTENPPEDPAK